MVLLIVFAIISFIIILGDIAWDCLNELRWHIGLRLHGKLHFMKKRRPDRTHWNYQ